VGKSNAQLAGIVLIVVGVGLAIWGYQMSGSFESRINEIFSGSPTDNVMFRYIGAAVCVAAGAFLFMKK
jgi:hypothetical protein